MKLKRRRYQHEEDYWRIRQFLREVYLQNERREVCWPLYRWDYWRWQINENHAQYRLEAAVFIWETVDNRLAAVLHPDRAGEAILQVHPDFRSSELEVEMLSTAETQFAVRQPEGQQQLTVWTHASERLQQDLLARRGYNRRGNPEIRFRRILDWAEPEYSLPPGYHIRPLGDSGELPARAGLGWTIFHPQEAEDKSCGWEWYRSIQRAPLYRRDLDLVAVGPDDELVGLSTLWFDDVSRTAAVEPLGVHPLHRGKGLTRALLVAGLQQAYLLGAGLATVGSTADAADELDPDLGFIEQEVLERWVKSW